MLSPASLFSSRPGWEKRGSGEKGRARVCARTSVVREHIHFCEQKGAFVCVRVTGGRRQRLVVGFCIERGGEREGGGV